MLTLGANVRIYVAVDPVDMRRSHDGLAAIMQEKLAFTRCRATWSCS